MRNFIAVVLLMCCFGIAKAHMVKKVHPYFTQKQFVVTGINRLKDYNVTFKVYKTPVKRWIKKNNIEMMNVISPQINPTKIEISLIEKDRNGFARKKLIPQNL